VGDGRVMTLPLKKMGVRPLTLPAMDSNRVPLIAAQKTNPHLPILARPLKSNSAIDDGPVASAGTKGGR
jgi:hypothetical protein